MIIEINQQLTSVMADIIVFSRKNAAQDLQSIINPQKYLNLTDEEFLQRFMPETERELLEILNKLSEYDSCNEAEECETSLGRFLLQNKKDIREEIYTECISLLNYISQLKSNQSNYDNGPSTEEDEDFHQMDLTSDNAKLKDSLSLQDRIVHNVYLSKIASSKTVEELQNVLESIPLLFSYHSRAPSRPRLYLASTQQDILLQLITNIKNKTLVINGDLDGNSSALTTAYGLRQKFKDLVIYDYKLITLEQSYKVSQTPYGMYSEVSTEPASTQENQVPRFQPN